MFRSQLLWKLYSGYVVLILLSTVVVVFLQSGQIDADARDDTASRLEDNAAILRELCREVLQSGESESILQARLTRLRQETSTRFTVIHRTGEVLADSDEAPAAMDDHGTRPEVLQARDSGRIGISDRFSATLGQTMVYVALPVLVGDELVGYARTARRRADLSAQVAGAQREMALGVLGVALLSCLIGFGVARRLTERLRSVTAAAEAMAAGDYDRRVEPMGTDEVGKLGRAFNAMSQELADRIETVGKERTELLTILESMVEGVVAVDASQRVMLINDNARRVLSVAPGDITGKPIWEATRVQAVCEIIDLVLAGAEHARDEVTLPSRHGDSSIELHSTQLRTERQQVAGAVVVLHDITEIRHLEKVRRDFVTNVSHELKTPLTAVRGFVETLLDDPETEPEIRQRFLGKICAHTHRLSALVTDLLTLSRVESQGVGPERRTFDLREPVRASASLLMSRAEEKGVRLQAEIPDRTLPVNGDVEMLRQAVDNLVDNAIKYTPAGGWVSLRLEERDKLATIEVQDTGVGLEPKHQQRIFERFYRVDRGRSRELGGTGLGLSIVKHVALAHQGSVSVDSTPGRGSTFRIEIPIDLSSRLAPTEPSRP